MSRASQTRALVIDHDVNRADLFVNVLQFIDCEADVLYSLESLQQAPKLASYQVIFVAQSTDALATVQGLQSEADDLPAFVMLNDGEPSAHSLPLIAPRETVRADQLRCDSARSARE